MQCQPIHAAWDLDGRCLSRGAKEGIVLVQAIISVVSDFAFAAFPILILWRVQIDLKTKIGLWCLMCLGFFTGACCLVRTVLNNEALPADETYDGIINWIWRLFEVTIGIIAACIPTLRPLYRVLSNRMRGKSRAMSTNIRMPLRKHDASWADKAYRRAGGVGAEEAGENAQDISEGEKADTMRKELEKEGIVKTNTQLLQEGNRGPVGHFVEGRMKKDRYAPNGGAPEGVAVHRPPLLGKEDKELEEDMQKYGI